MIYKDCGQNISMFYKVFAAFFTHLFIYAFITVPSDCLMVRHSILGIFMSRCAHLLSALIIVCLVIIKNE